MSEIVNYSTTSVIVYMLTLLYNGQIVNEGENFHGYIVIDDDTISEIGKNVPLPELIKHCDKCVDVKGALIVPGVIDEHVHFREPGMTHKGTIESESRAAVAGGVTSFMDMPNNNPFTITTQTLEAKFERAAQVSPINYSFYIGATNENIQLLKQVDYTKVCGVKAFLGSSTGGMLLSDHNAIKQLLTGVGTIIAIHSEDESIIKANTKQYMAQFGNDVPLCYHEQMRSAEACYVSTKRIAQLADECGARLHVLHVTTAGELALINGQNITGEATVAHLMFCNKDYERLGARIKCNPAIKTEYDREAIREALRNGTLSVIGTDHAPHLLSEKQGGALKAASGMPMVQFSLIAMLEMARQGIFSTEMVIDRMCHAPARLYGVERRGFLRKGYKADIAVVEAIEAGWTIDDKKVLSPCSWTPLNDTVVHHRVKMTFVNGQVAFCNGQVNENVRGERLTFKGRS